MTNDAVKLAECPMGTFALKTGVSDTECSKGTGDCPRGKATG